MKELAFRLRDWLALTGVFLLALGLRVGYLLEGTYQGEGKPAWQVQGEGTVVFAAARDGPAPTSEAADLIRAIRDREGYASRAPLAEGSEDTASLSPGYPWLAALAQRGDWNGVAVLRWNNVVLGALTALLYFLFARRVFRSLAVGIIAGLLTAAHPYWILNCAEIADGVLAAFLLASCLFLGTRASQEGGALTSLLFGVALAASALVRAALLPFSFLALLWFLARCQPLKQGWLCALLAFLGFANGLAPWLVRNWQTFDEPLPVVSSTWLHLWMGNNPRATGSYLDEAELRRSLTDDRLSSLLQEKNQARRYDALAKDTIAEITHYPGDALKRRLLSTTVFVLGEPWLHRHDLALRSNAALDAEVVDSSEWLNALVPGALAGSLIVMLVFGLWGWRRSLHWRRGISLATLAAIWVPLPYLLGHAGILVGPRLPVDGVWLTFAALGLAGILGLGPLWTEEEESARFLRLK